MTSKSKNKMHESHINTHRTVEVLEHMAKVGLPGILMLFYRIISMPCKQMNNSTYGDIFKRYTL
jgi:hypothetical protein